MTRLPHVVPLFVFSRLPIDRPWSLLTCSPLEVTPSAYYSVLQSEPQTISRVILSVFPRSHGNLQLSCSDIRGCGVFTCMRSDSVLGASSARLASVDLDKRKEEGESWWLPQRQIPCVRGTAVSPVPTSPHGVCWSMVDASKQRGTESIALKFVSWVVVSGRA